MTRSTSTSGWASGTANWRTPMVVIACGCLIGALTFGPRSTFGLFLQPMSQAFAWGRDVFAFAFAIQNLLWGMGQPIFGAVADRYGTTPVLMGGAILYATGLALMRWSSTPLAIELTLGLLVGVGLSACSFNVVVSAFGKIIPGEWRALALGAATAAGSFGQFLFAPASVGLMDAIGWQNTLTAFAVVVLIAVPAAMAIHTPPATPAGEGDDARANQSIRAALKEALGHRSYVLLVLGFFTCGFQLAFVTAHLPSYLVDRGLSAEVGGWVIAIIGMFNIAGALGVGWIGNRVPSRYILSVIYLIRALSIVALIYLPMTTTTAILFGMVTGLMWLSTVPPTSGLVALMFGTRWLATLFGIAFFSHQVGGFLGVWLGGVMFERTGSYDTVWWLSILFGILSAAINLPIVEKPVDQLRPRSA